MDQKKVIQKNDEYVIEITDLGSDGQGIGKIQTRTQPSEGAGYTLFVKDALIGDTVRVKVIKTKKNYGYGRLIEVITPSPYRTAPRCPQARACGGCQIKIGRAHV